MIKVLELISRFDMRTLYSDLSVERGYSSEASAVVTKITREEDESTWIVG